MCYFVKHRYVMHLQYQQVKGWLKERPYHQQRFYAFGKEKPIYLVLWWYLSHETNSKQERSYHKSTFPAKNELGLFTNESICSIILYSFRNLALQFRNVSYLLHTFSQALAMTKNSPLTPVIRQGCLSLLESSHLDRLIAEWIGRGIQGEGAAAAAKTVLGTGQVSFRVQLYCMLKSRDKRVLDYQSFAR